MGETDASCKDYCFLEVAADTLHNIPAVIAGACCMGAVVSLLLPVQHALCIVASQHYSSRTLEAYALA